MRKSTNEMTVADITKSDSQGQSIDALAGAIGQSVGEITSALLARVGASSSSIGRQRAIQARIAKTKDRLKVLLSTAAIVEDDGKGGKEALGSGSVEFAGKLDEFLEWIDQDIYMFSGHGREWRRANADLITVSKKMRETVAELREVVMDFVEKLDPTPESYLEDEMHRVYGDEAESVRSSFEYLATSEHFTKDAFKRRHALK